MNREGQRGLTFRVGGHPPAKPQGNDFLFLFLFLKNNLCRPGVEDAQECTLHTRHLKSIKGRKEKIVKKKQHECYWQSGKEQRDYKYQRGEGVERSDYQGGPPRTCQTLGWRTNFFVNFFLIIIIIIIILLFFRRGCGGQAA